MKNVDFKLHMLELVGTALDEMDTLADKEERTALVTWISGFWQENIDGLMAYAQMSEELKKDVKKALKARAVTAKKLLGER
jgi:hypothetical protein